MGQNDIELLFHEINVRITGEVEEFFKLWATEACKVFGFNQQVCSKIGFAIGENTQIKFDFQKEKRFSTCSCMVNERGYSSALIGSI